MTGSCFSSSIRDLWSGACRQSWSPKHSLQLFHTIFKWKLKLRKISSVDQFSTKVWWSRLLKKRGGDVSLQQPNQLLPATATSKDQLVDYLILHAVLAICPRSRISMLILMYPRVTGQELVWFIIKCFFQFGLFQNPILNSHVPIAWKTLFLPFLNWVHSDYGTSY